MGGCTERCNFCRNESEGSRQVQITTHLKKLNYRYYKNRRVCPTFNQFKIDSAATHHFHKIGSTNLPPQTTSNCNPAAQVIVPNVASMVSSATTHITITSLPPISTKSHGFNHISSESIFSFGQACDHNCTAVLTRIP